MLAAWLKTHFQRVWGAVFILSAVPGVALAIAYAYDNLGPNPLAMLMHTSGRSALVLLTLTLSITPLRRWLTQLSKSLHLRHGKRLADWNWLIRLRRTLGLWCFSYALIHFWIYVAFDLAYDLATAWVEMLEKPYLFAGAAAFFMLLPLAATSTSSMMRILGKNWRRLHTLTYAVALVSLLHFWWMLKPGIWKAWPETLALTILLGYRLALRLQWLKRWDGFDGTESSERPATSQLNSHSTPLKSEIYEK